MTEEPTPTTEKPMETPARTAAPKKDKGESSPFYWGTGRRKAAVARVRIRAGEGKFIDSTVGQTVNAATEGSVNWTGELKELQ